MTLVIRRSKIHADGCYTTEPIKKKGFVAEYSGPRITIAEADALYERSPRTYLFGLINGTHVIDGDSASAFINHSCDPNCEADEIDGKVIITAVRKIEAGEELTYDYNLYDGDLEDESPCFCGMKLCRGSMYSEKELEKRAKSKLAAKARQGTLSAKAEPSAAGTENIKARQSTRKRS
jgi:SET domain-containing protein